MSGFMTFKSFYTIEEAIEFSVLLNNKGVANRIKKPNFYNQWGATPDPLLQEFHVEIDEEDFEKANNVVENLR